MLQTLSHNNETIFRLLILPSLKNGVVHQILLTLHAIKTGHIIEWNEGETNMFGGMENTLHQTSMNSDEAILLPKLIKWEPKRPVLKVHVASSFKPQLNYSFNYYIGKRNMTQDIHS